MKEILEVVTQEVSRIAGKKVDPAVVRNSLLFTTASVMGLKRVYYVKNGIRKYANFFGITLAPSGEGKDLSLKICEDMFQGALVPYPKVVKADFERLNGPLPTGEGGNDDQDYIAPSQYKVSLEGTSQGMMRVANFYNRTDRGSLNVISTEFGHELSSSVLPILTKLWQEAKADGSTNVNEKYPPVADVPTNILLFGSNAPFERNGVKHEQLVEAIEAGLARRTFFVWSARDSIEEYRERETYSGIIEEFGKQVIEHIKASTSGYRWTDEAVDALERYKSRLPSS
jgi:hypothetical protein